MSLSAVFAPGQVPLWTPFCDMSSIRLKIPKFKGEEFGEVPSLPRKRRVGITKWGRDLLACNAELAVNPSLGSTVCEMDTRRMEFLVALQIPCPIRPTFAVSSLALTGFIRRCRVDNKPSPECALIRKPSDGRLMGFEASKTSETPQKVKAMEASRVEEGPYSMPERH